MITRFEEIGVDRQWDALNPYQAKKQLEISCKLCCEKGLRIACDRCHIQEAHGLVMELKFPKYKDIFKKAEEA